MVATDEVSRDEVGGVSLYVLYPEDELVQDYEVICQTKME